MKYFLALVIFYSLNASATPKWIKCDIIDSEQSRNILGEFETNLNTKEIKIKMSSSDGEIINDANTICGIQLANIEVEVRETT